MSGGQMVMGSAMGAGGAQFGGGGFGGDFGGSSFGQPQPDFGSQPVGGGFGSQPVGGDFGGGGFGQPQQFGSQDFGGGGFGQPASVGFGASPLTRENQAVVPPPLPPAGGPFNVCVLASVCWRFLYAGRSSLDLFEIPRFS
jgi:hypothetical protein